MVDCGRILATSGNKFMVRSMDCTCPQLWQHPLPPAEPPRHYPPVRQVLRSHCGPKPQAQWTWRTWRATPPAKAEIHGPIMSLRKPLLRFTSCFRCSKKCSQHLTTSLLHSHLGVRSTSLTRTHDKKMEHIASYCCVPKSRNWGNPTALPGPARMKCLGSPGARDPQVSCCWQCQTPVKRRLRLHHAPSPYIYTSITKKILYCPS